MPEFRYQGVDLSGGMVQGILQAPSRPEAKKRAEEISRRQRIRLTRLQRKSTFRYKVQRGREKPIQGEQRAFSREEVERGLEKLNYRVLRLQKKFLDFKLPPPARDIVLLNAGAAIYAANITDSLAAGIEKARQVVASGAAQAKFDTLIAYSRDGFHDNRG